MILPPLYAIIDLGCFSSADDPIAAVARFCEALLDGGASLIQLRDKSGDWPRFLGCARELRRITLDRAKLIINDRADFCLAVDADGLHLGQDDLSPERARRIFASTVSNSSAPSTFLIGFSTHGFEQVRLADAMPIDYIAVGPVFATSSKARPDPLIGIEGVRQARAATRKPLVAIGGITRKNCRQLREAGADSVAVIADLLDSPAKAVEEFLAVLG